MRLHIGNLPSTVTETELKDLMVPFAAPASLEIIKDHGGVSKGFGFADFAEAEGARAVITGLDGKEIDGKTLKVAEARPRKAERA
jgi:RNA recognition motif-containing protein